MSELFGGALLIDRLEQARSEAAMHLDERSEGGLRQIPVSSGHAPTSAGWGAELCTIGEVRA